MRWDRNRFRYVSRPTGDGFQRVCQARCACGALGEIVDSTRSSLPPELVAKKFSLLGWDIGANADRDRCPLCTKPKVVPMKAEPPRLPTREDRRRVTEALEAHYDVKNERYTASWSDKALAAQLGMPVGWVAEERDRAYGPDVNEKNAERASEAAAIRAEMERLQSELIVQFDLLDGRLKRLEVDVSYAAKAG